MKQPTSEHETSGHVGPMSSHEGETHPKSEAEGRRFRFKHEDNPQGPPPAASGHFGPKPSDDGDECRGPDKDGQRFRSEHREATREPSPGSPKWQKSENFQEDSRQARFSERLRHDGEGAPPGGDASGSTAGPDKKAARNGRRMEKSKLRAEKSGAKLNEARTKLAAKKPRKPPGVVKALMRKAGTGAWYYAHQKIREVEHENVGVEAAHKTELAEEGVIRGTTRFVKHRIRTHPARRVAKLERRDIKAKADYAFRKLAQEHPEIKSNPISRYWQKRRLRKQYAKKTREAAKQGARAAKGAVSVIQKFVSALWTAATSHPVAVLIIICIFILIVALQSCVASMGTIGNGILGAVGGTSYVAQDTDIDQAELAYTGWEADLQLEIDNAKTTHPGYDEYRYNVEDISHNPYELMAFLTAVYGNFTYSDVESNLQQIFHEQYTLSFTEDVETKTRTVTGTDPATGQETESEETYDWHVLNITLTAKSFTDVVSSLMDSGQLQQYNVLMTTKGNRQYLQNPFSFDWLPYVTDYYGYYADQSTDTKEYRKGVDIGVPSGTAVMSGLDGTVTSTGDDSGGKTVVLDDGNGLTVKYEHCGSLTVSTGQTVKAGDMIAKAGGTGLYLEVDKDGQPLNPLYFAVTGDEGQGPSYSADPGAPMGGGSYAALIAEAEKYLGYPYVWGGSTPETSFDCSGYVCWVLDQSGVANVGRTTAQGLYNLCTPVPASEAQPGDLVFFQGTYSTSSTVTHVGIYVGNGRMIQAGNPIGYADITTSYWQSHFYAFGRIH